MFSGFDNLAEGFKRFSLDALQDQDDENTSKDDQQRLPVLPEQQHPTEHTESPTKEPPPQPAEVEDNEWNWDQDNAGATDALREGVGGLQQKHVAHLGNSPQATSAAPAGISPAAVASPSELDQSTFDGQAGGVVVEAEEPLRENAGTQAAEEGMEERREGQMFGGEKNSGPSTFARDSSASSSPVEKGFSDNTDTPAALGRSEPCSRTIEDGTEDVHLGNAPTPDPSSSGKLQNCLEGSKPAAAKAVGLATDEGVATNTTNDSSAAGPTGTNGGGERRVDHQENGESIEDGSSPQNSPEAATAGVAGTTVVDPAEDTTTAGPLTVVAMRQELSLVKNAASGLEGALRESRSEVQLLRELLATEQDTTRKLSDEVNATRMGFQESNAAHQRTAEQSHALEEELYNTRTVVESLRAESAALKAKVDEGVEDRHALEGKLRHLQAGLTEGQEAARQEGRQEVERLEARIRDLLKDRDRKQAELDLQNARRKETREMARDLESQLAAVERIAQEREVELSKQRDDMVALKKNTGEATDQKKTWATKYEALERNFKQVRAQSKRIESELDEARENVTRIEAEKAVLEERVDVEGAERVTVVTSVSQERDFLLRQVDRLEQEVVELRRSQEAQATAAAARAQTTGVLEEYRTRAQQALKRANEITSQTASENKRLEAEMSKLSDEVAQQRPLWEQSKQLEEVHRAEVAELKEKLANQATELGNMATAAAALEAQVSEKEEERRDAHTSVMRLEAQGKSLKQELQRQQKALAAAQETESTLQTRLADQEAALQDAENRQRRKHSPEKVDVNADMGKNLSSPTPAVSSLSMGWDEEKHGSRNGTPRRGMGTGATGAAWPERRSLGESVSSMPSEADSADVAQGSVGEQLFYVHQLRERMSKEQIEMRSLISELEASRAAADAQAAKQAQLEKQLDAALLDKKRLQDLDSGRNAAINLEYLKNCVVGALRTSEPSEHARLLPVITTILKLSEDEAAVIAKNISTRAQHQGSFGGSLPPGGDARASSSSSSSRSWWSSNPHQK
ncbi:Myosin, heavy chain 10, non-muscle [Ectocarpus siliculosus]|uniref:Myosin, heavy chain 10, non-muscle n=1 Tax=Ectocarpus siliculosus TaxID=2880 RepID=D7FW73_ECTSI|nr:Myosin, heavy chain 10, non-muscle [Ectocarpus siliculosus]|eukprot:CBJ25593.1 Myosin, heavy chain 10, non-muscle [Ectocarpus siliculosus]